MEFRVKDSKLFIGNHELDNYKIERELGKGANGIVFLVKNLTLGRDEALKIWIKRKTSDNRDKLKQGLYEVQKLARVDGNNAVSIYSAQEINGHMVATMEYFNGQTMKNFIIGKTSLQICSILRNYLEAIEQTSNLDTFHGDAHENNVLIREKRIRYENKIELKLCDFGTSVFSGQDQSFDRHWSIVRETLLRCTRNMKSAKNAVQLLNDCQKSMLVMQRDMMDKFKKGEPDFYSASIFTSSYKDYLEYLESENG